MTNATREEAGAKYRRTVSAGIYDIPGLTEDVDTICRELERNVSWVVRRALIDFVEKYKRMKVYANEHQEQLPFREDDTGPD